MAQTGNISGAVQSKEKLVNKCQRYACLRKLVQQSGVKALEELIKKEYATDYSASDDLEMLRVQAADPNQENKQLIWNKYVAKDS